MKTTNKILGIILAIAMLLSMAPISAFAAAEALVLKRNAYSKVAYSDNVTQYYRDNNYLYKVTYSNLKNITQVSISYDYGYQLCLHYTRSDTGNSSYEWLYKAKKDIAYTGDLPKTPGSTLSCLTTYDKIYIDENKPAVTITCLALNAPDWTWNGASATAVFTSADGKAKMTLTPEVTSSTQAAENCLSKDKITYTATVTANGQTYTDQTTAEGEIGNHSGGTQTCKGYKCDLCKEWYGEANPDAHNWSKLDGVCTLCNNTCAHNNLNGKTCTVCGAELHFHEWIYTANGNKITAVCTNDDGKCDNTNGGYIAISAPADLYADGITAKEATVENNLVDTSVAVSDITYSSGSAPKTAGTYTASVTIGGATASIEYTLVKRNAAADMFVFSAPANLVYDGTAKYATVEVSPEITGMGAVTVTYYKDGVAVDPINAGTYTVKVSTEASDAYNAMPEVAIGTMTIEKKEITASATAPDKIYDGTTTVDASTVSIIFDGIVDGDDVKAESVIAMFKNANAGNNKTVIVAYKAVGEDVDNYEVYTDYVTFPENEFYYIETKANILPKDIFDAEIVLGEALVYNGAEQTQSIASVTVDGFDVTYDVSGNTATNAGTYELTITGNGNFTGTKTALFTITPKDISGGEVVFGDALKYIGCEQVMTVESVTVDGMDVTYTASGYIATNVGVYPLTVTGTGNFCGEITVLYEIEVNTSAIDGINISNVKSTDIVAIEYFLYQLDNAVTDYADEDKLAEWDELRAYCNELLAKEKEITEEYKRIILAVRSYDESTVKSADKDALIQLNKDIYALALTDNLTEQKIQGLEEAHDKILVLLDKITVISDELKRIIEEVDKYVFESVKSTDKADIEQLIKDIAVLLATQNLTDEERALLENADEICDKLIAKIDETVDEVERINTETNAYDPATVTSADKSDIEALIAAIKILTDGDNITAEEETQLEGNKATLEAFLAIIKAVADEIEKIEDAVNSYDEKSVKSTDKEALEQLKARIKALADKTNITDEERAKLGELDATTIDALLKKIADTQAEIERIDEAVDGYDIETVNSGDVQALGNLIEDIETLTNGDNITEEEKAALEEKDAAIDELIDRLAEVAEEIAKVNDAVNSYDENSIKSSDSEDLEQLKEDIQAVIDCGNVTENEITALEEMIADVEALEDKIAETEEQLEKIQDIENGYDPETVTSDDKEAIETTLAEIDAINPDNLTDEQKAEYEEIKEELEVLLDQIADAQAKVENAGAELGAFDEDRVTIFQEDELEAYKAKVEELLANANMGEAEKAKLNEYNEYVDMLIETINNPADYFSARLSWFVKDCLNWKWDTFIYYVKTAIGIFFDGVLFLMRLV